MTLLIEEKNSGLIIFICEYYAFYSNKQKQLLPFSVINYINLLNDDIGIVQGDERRQHGKAL